MNTLFDERDVFKQDETTPELIHFPKYLSQCIESDLYDKDVQFFQQPLIFDLVFKLFSCPVNCFLDSSKKIIEIKLKRSNHSIKKIKQCFEYFMKRYNFVNNNEDWDIKSITHDYSLIRIKPSSYLSSCFHNGNYTQWPIELFDKGLAGKRLATYFLTSVLMAGSDFTIDRNDERIPYWLIHSDYKKIIKTFNDSLHQVKIDVTSLGRKTYNFSMSLISQTDNNDISSKSSKNNSECNADIEQTSNNTKTPESEKTCESPSEKADRLKKQIESSLNQENSASKKENNKNSYVQYIKTNSGSQQDRTIVISSESSIEITEPPNEKTPDFLYDEYADAEVKKEIVNNEDEFSQNQLLLEFQKKTNENTANFLNQNYNFLNRDQETKDNILNIINGGSSKCQQTFINYSQS